jgi:hypothetical protein
MLSKFLLKNVKGKDHLGGICVDERITLTFIILE